jgi:hypothetical protein
MTGVDDFSGRPSWASIVAEPPDGWRRYRENAQHARRRLVRGYRTDLVTREAVQFLTRWLIPSRRLIDVIEYLAGYRPVWAGAASAVRDGDSWRPATPDEFDAGSARTVSVLPVWVCTSDLITAVDTVAWAPSRPDSWALRTGLADYLGDARLQDALMDRGRLRVYATPAAWAAGDADWPGVCVLQDGRDVGRNVWREFIGAGDLVCDSEDHAATVHREIRRAPKRALPKIRIIKPTARGNDVQAETTKGAAA